MHITKKIILSVSLLLSLSILILCSQSVYSIWNRGQDEIKDFREAQIENKKDYLIDIVDVTYGMIVTEYQKTQNSDEVLPYIYTLAGYIIKSVNMEALGDEILKHISSYMQVNQWAIYILEDGEGTEFAYLNQVSNYANGIKKSIENRVDRVDIGEGLIRQSFLEKEKIVLNEIPEKYIKITSGLGGDFPVMISILPLIPDEEIMGILEIASFHKLYDHQFEFLEQLCESISTVRALRTNNHTKIY